MKKNYLYIIQKENNPFEIKIGVTDDIDKRLKTLQTGNSDNLFVYHYEEREDAYKIEKKLHKIFSENRINDREKSEWFYIDPIIVRKKILIL